MSADPEATPAPASPGRRELNRLATTQAIVDACLDLGEDLGWDAVTVDAVAQRAGISRRTFFNYFSSLAEAAHHPLSVLVEDAVARLHAQPDPQTCSYTTPQSTPVDFTQALTNSVKQDLLQPVARTLLLARTSPTLRAESHTAWEASIAILLDPFATLSGPAKLFVEVHVRATVAASQVAFEHWAADLTTHPTEADVLALREQVGFAASLVAPQRNHNHPDWPPWLPEADRERIAHALPLACHQPDQPPQP